MKRVFTVISILAVIHVAALAAGVGFAWHSKWLARDRLREAWAALRGESACPHGPTSAAADEDESVAMASQIGQGVVEPIVRTQLAVQERRIEDAWRDLEQRQLALLREKEAFDETARRRKLEAEERAKASDDSGMQKEVDLFAKMKPKLAKDLLKGRADAEAAAILMIMDGRTAKRIVDQCKTSEDRQWIGRILGQLKERDATQAEALGAGTQLSTGA